MRQEDKEVDGFELEREEERKRDTELVEEDEEELHDLDGKPELGREEDRSSTVIAAMRKILEREHIVIESLELDKRELRALEALRTAVEGRDPEVNGFVFAEDRRTLLEQALAVLQPDIATLEKLGGKGFQELVQQVAGLRSTLNGLEDAQEEIVPHKRALYRGEAPETDDKPDDKPVDEDVSLTGPARKVKKRASSLTGPEVKEPPKPVSSLVGPEIEPEPKPQTTLGDPKEIAAAAKPFWKRSDG